MKNTTSKIKLIIKIKMSSGGAECKNPHCEAYRQKTIVEERNGEAYCSLCYHMCSKINQIVIGLDFNPDGRTVGRFVNKDYPNCKY